MRSFTDLEHQLAPRLRRQIAAAESTEDVKKFFAQAGRDLLNQIFDGLDATTDDVVLLPSDGPFFELAPRVSDHSQVAQLWDTSDLKHVIGRFAETAAHRFRHLKKNPEKTESKIRHR